MCGQPIYIHPLARPSHRRRLTHLSLLVPHGTRFGCYIRVLRRITPTLPDGSASLGHLCAMSSPFSIRVDLDAIRLDD